VATFLAGAIASLSSVSYVEIRGSSRVWKSDQSALWKAVMYLRRHVRQPILLRLFAGLPCD
jgi:hypothetical protein